MPEQIIDTAMARSLHADTSRGHPMVAWVVMDALPAYPGKVVACLVTCVPTSHLLVADSLAGIREQLPPGLARMERQPADPPEVVEVWFAEVASARAGQQ